MKVKDREEGLKKEVMLTVRNNKASVSWSPQREVIKRRVRKRKRKGS